MYSFVALQGAGQGVHRIGPVASRGLPGGVPAHWHASRCPQTGVFVGLSGMRALLGNAGPILVETELRELERLNALYHDCLNGSFTSSTSLLVSGNCANLFPEYLPGL